MNETPLTPAAAAPKPIFKSKTVVANLIVTAVGALALNQPAVADFVKNNAGLIVTGLGILNVGLRFVTRGRVNLFGE